MASAKCVLWLTGENGAERDALARSLESQLAAKNYPAAVFDAAHLSSRQPESFRQESERHDDERLTGSINDLLMREDVVIVAADAAPPSGLGEQVGQNNNVLIEVFMRPSAGGESPVESASRIVVNSGADALPGNVELILARLEDARSKQGEKPVATNDYSEEDEEIVRRRLEDLGYI